MAISPIEFNATISRTQDFTTIKHNEDQKGMINQSNFQTQMDKETKQHLKQVRNANNADKKQDNTDAKEKGNGQYFGDGGRNRKRNMPPSVGDKVTGKKSGGFDISI